MSYIVKGPIIVTSQSIAFELQPITVGEKLINFNFNLIIL
jgi:hypothetical protein